MGDHPPCVALAQPDGEPQAVGWVPAELLLGTTAEQRPDEGDVVAGGDVHLLDLERCPDRCHSKNGGQVSR